MKQYEDVHHQLAQNTLHVEKLINNLKMAGRKICLDNKMLTCINFQLSNEQTLQIFEHVHNFIKRSTNF